ncbi:hypothetical protein ES150_16445 [Enterobacillus tribolii]|nr:hypothetical protein [Enterobacillus tribolii]
MPAATVSIPHHRAVHSQRSSGRFILPTTEIAIRKARFTEHQIIAVMKWVEAGRTVKDACRNTCDSPPYRIRRAYCGLSTLRLWREITRGVAK